MGNTARRARAVLAVALAAGLLGCTSGATRQASPAGTVANAAPVSSTAAKTARTTSTTRPVTTTTRTTVRLYSVTLTPKVPQITAPIVTFGALPDGAYWGQLISDPGYPSAVNLLLTQAFFGQACVQRFGSAKKDCPNGFNTLDSPSITTHTSAATIRRVTVWDTRRKRSLTSSGVELVRFARLATFTANTPKGFNFHASPFLVKIIGGKVDSVEQVFTS